MSINITVHGKPASVFKEKHLLFNPELAKKIETEQRKKLRLEQVREQSKEFASQIRNRVNEERKKQLNKYEVTRTNELKKWQKGKLEKAQDAYSAAISSVGEAHTAALNEANANVIREATKTKNDTIAAQRGREAAALLKKRENISLPKKTFVSRDIKNKTQKEQDVLEKGNKKPAIMVINKVKNIVKQTSPSKIEKAVINKHIYPDVEIEHIIDSESDTELSELINTPGKQFKNQSMKKLNAFNESSDLEQITIDTDEEDLFTTKGKNDKISPKKQIQPNVTKRPYNPNDYRAKSSSPDSIYSPNRQAAKIKPFTQVSDLLQRRSRKVSRETSDNINNNTSGNIKSSKDNKVNLEKPIIDSKKKIEKDEVLKSPKKTVIVDKIASPKKSDIPKVNKDKLISSNSNNNNNDKKNVTDKSSPSIKSIKHLQNQYNKHTIKSQIENINPNEQLKVNTRVIVKKQPFISSTKTSIINNDNSNKKFSSVDRFSHSSKQDSTKTDYTNKSENKVQYYDHENRFSKEYIPQESLVIRNESQDDEKNAMEEAQIFIEAQKIRSQQLDDLRQRESIRSMKALEKVEMRKEYDLLTNQLEALSKKENLTKSIINYKNIDEITRKMANERQKKLNEAFKKIGHQPVIITTPTIHEETRSNYSTMRFNYKSNAELNVADIHNDSHEENINSSDSCASILLGYVNNQSAEISQQINKIQTTNPLEDNNNNNVNKLRDLLIRINNQKALLLNELKNNNSIPAKSMTKVLESLRNIEREKDLIVLLEPKGKTKNDSKINEKEIKLKNDLISLEQREKLLKEKEHQIDKKMLQLYETEKKQKKLDEIENYIKKINVNQLKASRNIEVETDKNSQNKVEVIQESCTSSNDQEMDNVQNGPIKIIIKVNDQLRKKAFKSPKRRSLYKKSLEKISKSPGKSYPKTPKRKSYCSDKTESMEIMKNKLLKNTAAVLQIPNCKPASEMSITSSSTQYRSPPDQVKTTLSQFFIKQKMENDGKFSKWSEKNQLQNTQQSVPRNKNLNPSLVHYITRLLGMSRQSIEQLGVSTSTDVSTPGDSVINVTGNISMDSSTDNRMERLKKFIDENYSFLSDLEESLKDECISDSYEQKMKEIEKIWMIMLKKKEKEMEASKLRKRNEEMKQIEKKLKPALKNWKKSNTQNVDKETCCSSKNNNNVEADPLQKNILIKDAAKNIITLADEIDDEIADKYNKVTETCNQRIADLASMIKKVRQEKHRLLESSNFSGSDQIEQSTEYMEFAQRNTGSLHSGDTSRIDVNNREELVHDAVEVNRLDGNRLIGLSKDSGISISRPLTATGMRDSPEVRHDGTRDFEPLLKDIPKVFTSRRLNEETNENNTLRERSDDILSISSNNIFAARKYAGELTNSSGSLNVQTYKDVQVQKRTKPVSTRYSPIMDQGPIHELSTIIEVDTPAASKINTSIYMDEQSFGQENTKAQATQTNLCERNYSLEISNKSEVIAHDKFLTYEEYVKQQKLDKSQCEKLKTTQPNISGRNFSLEISNKSEVIAHDKFLTYEEYVKQQKLDNSGNKIQVEKVLEEEITELEYRRFPTRREYNQAQGITDHVDSQCLDSVDDDKVDIDSKNSSSNSSLPDVVAELKRRNVLQDSFHNEVNDSNRSARVSESLHRILLKGNETPKKKIESKNTPNSPRKKQSENRTGLRTPQKKIDEGRSKDQHTPTKNKPHSVTRSPKKNHLQNHDMSGFDVLQKSSDSGKQLEQELSNMGLNWAATMMKKIQESHTISSTSDSSAKQTLPKRKSPKKKLIHDSNDDGAVQTLLDSNIAREALKIKEHAENEESDTEESFSETKPLNLKQFLARELMRRTNTDVHTSTNDESSSLASQFLRSLMQTSINATPLNTASKTGQQRTSTPVFSKSTSTSQDDKPNASSGLFSGISRISSVRFSSSEPSNSHSVDKKSDSLMVPNLKLNLDKYKQSTSNESSNSSS